MQERIEIKQDIQLGIQSFEIFTIKVQDTIIQMIKDALEKYTGEIPEDILYSDEVDFKEYLSEFGIVMHRADYTVTYLKDNDVILSYTFSELESNEKYYKFDVLVEKM